jgi:hypothetical protein
MLDSNPAARRKSGPSIRIWRDDVDTKVESRGLQERETGLKSESGDAANYV